MATVTMNDGDVSEFEKLSNSLEFENKQYVKMIEKENQMISSLQSQIHEKKELINRRETEISGLDENTMRLHKQFLHAKETLKNLKDTYNVMMDHERALCNQLETLKIKSEGERQFYQEQMAHYSKIKVDYMKKYQSFPLAQELSSCQERLREMQNESNEKEAIISKLQQQIAEKEAILDSKVIHRMIINIAKLKLSTLQTEKEIHECLVEKTSLLEQLKEIQRNEDHHEETNYQEASYEKTDAEDEKENIMDFEEARNDKDTDIMIEPDSRCMMSKDYAAISRDDRGEEKSGGFSTHPSNSKNDDMMMAALTTITEEKKVVLEDHTNQDKHCNDAANLTESYSERTQQPPQGTTDAEIYSTGSPLIQSSQNVRSSNSTSVAMSHAVRKEPAVSVPSQNATAAAPQSSIMSGLRDRIKVRALPTIKPTQRLMPKMPVFKPLEILRTPSSSRQISTKLGQMSSVPPMPQVDTPRPSVPAFTHRVAAVRPITIPKVPSHVNRYTDSVAPLKAAAPSTSTTGNQKTDFRKRPTTTATPTTTVQAPSFSFPKLPECSTLPSNRRSAFLMRSVIQPDTPKELTNTGRTSNISVGDAVGKPLFKPTSMKDALQSLQAATNQPPPPSPPPPSSLHQGPSYSSSTSSTVVGCDAATRDQQQQGKPKSFGFGSVFNCSTTEDNSSSPTAFSLININLRNDDHHHNTSGTPDSQSPFVAFGNTPGSDGGGCGIDGMDDERPDSLLNLFNSPTTDTPSNASSQPQFCMNFGGGGRSNNNDGDDSDTAASFFNFGSSHFKDEASPSGGGFLNFGTEFDKDSDRREPSFKLF